MCIREGEEAARVRHCVGGRRRCGCIGGCGCGCGRELGLGEEGRQNPVQVVLLLTWVSHHYRVNCIPVSSPDSNVSVKLQKGERKTSHNASLEKRPFVES